MFSKLMKKTIAAVAMLAMASAFAGVTTTWWNINFDNIEDGGKLSGVAGWTQETDDESSVQGGVLSLNTQGKDLTWTPSENTEKFDSVILDADVTFVASDVVPTTDASMQTAIYLKAKEDGTNVLCAYGKDNGTAKWIELFDGSNLAEGKYDVNITINYTADVEPMVKITVGDMVDEYPAAIKKETVSSVAFRGTGFVDNFKGEKYLEKTYVANVGDVQFEKYAEALDYLAANGGTLTITGDSTEELSFGTFTFDDGVNATIDLGGKEITAAFVVDEGANLTIDNGTVNAPMGSDVIAIYNGTATVGADAVLNASDNCVVFMKNTADAGAELALDVYGKLYVKNNTGYAAIQGNGRNKPASTINIFDGAEVAHDFDTAIYHPQNGTLTVGKATITGTTGIEMRAGSLVVDGATITATGKFDATANNNGSTVLGAAIALSQHTTEKPTSVEVKAGSLAGEYAFYQTNLADGTSESVEATIAAGTTINGAVATAEKGFVMPEVDGSYTLATADFIVAGKPYNTFADAYAAAAEGATIEVYTDFSATEIIRIAKGITIEGNGHTLTSTAARAINVDGANGATIEDLTIVTTGERGINIIGGATNVTIDNVDVTAANYAVNLAASASGAVVTITDSTLTGLNAFNAGAANAVVTIAGSEIYSNDNSENESYGAISLNPDAAGTQVVVTGSQFYIKDDSFVAINGASGKGATITIVGSSDAVTSVVAAIDCAGGYSKLFTSLADAIEEAKAGETVKLIANVAEDVAISGTTTIDLNDYGATGTFTLTNAAAKLYAAEGLKVVTNDEGYKVVFADGCYSVQEIVVEIEFAPVKTTSIAIVGDEAKLTIDGEYTEVKVYFKETLNAEFDEITAEFKDGVITVDATTDTGFFTVHAR